MPSQPSAIPRKGLSDPSYQVSRYSEAAAASSNQIRYRDEENERSNTPPPYSGPTSPSLTSTPAPHAQSFYPGLPRIDYRLYSPGGFTLSADQTSITSYHPRLNSHTSALVDLIQLLATVPPKPQIRIVGKSPHGTIDFDVRINLMNLIVPDDDRRRMNYVKIIGPGEMGFRGNAKATTVPTLTDLEAWAKKYCADTSTIKQFVLERVVTNWDTSYLEGRLLSLVSSTAYTGHVTVTFPSTHNKVIIHSPDQVNRFFTDVTKVFTGTKKYEVVKSVWPYANVARAEQGRTCAVQEEEVWFTDWKDAIRQAVMTRRHGWCTGEDRLEFLMEPKMGENIKPEPW